MKKKIAVLTFCAMLLALCSTSEAQQPTKIPRIGYLTGATRDGQAARIEAFRKGKTSSSSIDMQRENFDRLPGLAAELVRLKVDVIVTGGGPNTRAAKEATTTIPIVMAQDTDPVANGFVASLARPGGNITGLANLAPELMGKQLELLKEIIPKLSRVSVLGSAAQPGNAEALRELELTAGTFGVRLQYLDVLSSKDIETAFRAMRKGRVEAVLVLGNQTLLSQRTRLAELAVKSRLPAMYYRREYVEDGGLMSYDANPNDLTRRAATYVDKILKGTKPADLPVEQPKKFELIINLKTANQIGLTIPPNVLVRADRVIKER